MKNEKDIPGEHREDEDIILCLVDGSTSLETSKQCDPGCTWYIDGQCHLNAQYSWNEAEKRVRRKISDEIGMKL